MTHHPVKVLHVHTLPVISGSGLNTFLSMKGQHEAGFDVELACAPGGPLLGLVEKNGIAVHRLKYMVWALNPVHDLLAVPELCRLMRRSGYAVVHTHNSKAGFLGRLAARLAGVPVIVHTIHGFAFHDKEPRWKQALYRALERLAAGWCDKLILISQPLVEWAKKERIGKPSQMVKIYSGVDLDAFRKPADSIALRRSFGLSPDEVIVGEVAKLWEGKGHDVLMQAIASVASRCPKIRLMLIGEGALRSALEQSAKRLSIAERVIFTGFREDIPALTQLLDIAVLPSLFEGMGRAIIEAQAAGKAVIGSRVGGIPDLIEDGKTGLLVPAGNSEALARAIEQLYHDGELRTRMGLTSQQAVDARFDIRTMNRQILRVYDELLTMKGKG